MDGVRKDFTDARLRHDVQADLEARRVMMQVEMGRIEETTRRFEHIAMGGTGMIPKVEIPLLAYHSWAAKFKMKDVKAGITTTTGYECWQKGSGFREWWIKNNERLRYREAKKCQQSSIVVASKYTDVRKAAA